MKYITTFSGGKDSLDTIIWCMDNLHLDQWEVVFCDTEWEDEITYEHIKYVEEKIGKKVIVLKHKAFDISDENREAIRKIFGKDNLFAEMVIYKSRFPSTKARFCTEELKSKPMIDYVLSIDDDVTILQGVRSEESLARAMLKEKDDYFRFYFEPYKIDKKGNKKYHSYRKADIVVRCETYYTNVLRPILSKTALEVFDSIYSHGFKPNELYKMGMARVGCFPCIMCRKLEIKNVATLRPIRIIQIEALEALCNSTFFPPNYIPIRFCTKVANVKLYLEDLIESNPKLYRSIMEEVTVEKLTDEDGGVYVIKKMKVPTIKDVVKYVSDNPDQSKLFEPITGCISVYNICETN